MLRKTFQIIYKLMLRRKVLRGYKKQSSLQYYKVIKEDTNLSNYLCCRSSFKGIQLKYKLRCGVSGLGEDLHCQNRGNGFCKFCGCYESLKHFLFHCNAYSNERLTLYKNLKFSCNHELFSLFLKDINFAICMLLGDQDDVINGHALKYFTSAWSIRDSF